MDFRNKVWCISPNCKGKCKRKLSEKEAILAAALGEDRHMNYAYFCGYPDDMSMIDRLKAKYSGALERLKSR